MAFNFNPSGGVGNAGYYTGGLSGSNPLNAPLYQQEAASSAQGAQQDLAQQRLANQGSLDVAKTQADAATFGARAREQRLQQLMPYFTPLLGDLGSFVRNDAAALGGLTSGSAGGGGSFAAAPQMPEKPVLAPPNLPAPNYVRAGGNALLNRLS